MSWENVRTIDLPQGRIAYRERGKGQPVLFVHGWPLSSLTWRKVIPALEQRHRCIAVDLLGFGETNGGPRRRPIDPGTVADAQRVHRRPWVGIG